MKGLAIVLGGKGKPEADEGKKSSLYDDESAESEGGDEDVAADELWDAVKSDDKTAFKAALKSYVAACVHAEMAES